MMEVATRLMVNGVVIPNGWADDGTRDFSAISLVGMLQSWSGPISLTVLARTTSFTSPGQEGAVIAPCAVDTGTVQFSALADSV